MAAVGYTGFQGEPLRPLPVLPVLAQAQNPEQAAQELHMKNLSKGLVVAASLYFNSKYNYALVPAIIIGSVVKIGVDVMMRKKELTPDRVVKSASIGSAISLAEVFANGYLSNWSWYFQAPVYLISACISKSPQNPDAPQEPQNAQNSVTFRAAKQFNDSVTNFGTLKAGEAVFGYALSGLYNMASSVCSGVLGIFSSAKVPA
jgi:hypothetical protein